MKYIAIVAAVTLIPAGSLIAAEEKKESKSSSAAAAKSAAGEPNIQAADSLEWADAPPGLPAGGKLTVLDGDPGKRGSFIARLKMPADYKIMPHTHPAAERVTVISGTLYVGTGDTLDENAGRKLSAGDFIVIPKGSKHSAWTATEEAVIQIQSEGPFDVYYTNTADDPRKQKKD